MKFLKYLCPIILFLLSNFTIVAERNSIGNVIISGKVINMTDKSPKVITAINCNPWNDKTSRHAAMIDSAGQFNTYVDLPFGHNFTIYYDRSFFCQYAEPGDTLFLTIDAANLKSGARYAGSHEKFNNEYGKAYADMYSKSFVELPSGEMSKEEYLYHFERIYSGLKETLNHYADSVGLGEDSKDLMRRSFLFSVANSALGHKDRSPERVLEFFADPLFGLDDEDNLQEMMFPYHLRAYLNRLEDVVNPDSPIQMIDAIAERHPKSLNRDVMMATYLRESDEGDGYPGISRELFTDSNIYNFLYGQQTNEQSLPDDYLPDGLIYEAKNGEIRQSEYSNLTELLKAEFNGKIVYLDLWATWCGPCIQANRSLPEVADFFKNEDVVLVSVALRSDFDKWKKLVDAHPANCRDYLIRSDDDAELIMSTYGMNGFPAYRIIDKNSEIINQNPPRPNNPAIYDTIQKLLQKP